MPSEFREGQIDGVQILPLRTFRDGRGWLIELFRHDELPPEVHPQMAYVSETLPGVTRGPHEHVEQTDIFAFVGPGDFKLYLWDARPQSPTAGHRLTHVVGASWPVTVVVPPGVVHAYRNAGDCPAWAFNCPNRLYAGDGRRQPIDEIRHEDRPDSPFVLD